MEKALNCSIRGRFGPQREGLLARFAGWVIDWRAASTTPRARAKRAREREGGTFREHSVERTTFVRAARVMVVAPRQLCHGLTRVETVSFR